MEDPETDDEGNPAPTDPPNHEGYCEECGKKPGKWELDPFQQTVHYRKVWIFACRPCLGSIADSI